MARARVTVKRQIRMALFWHMAAGIARVLPVYPILTSQTGSKVLLSMAKVLWLLVSAEVILLGVLLWTRRCFATPCLFGYVLFSIASALTFSPSDVAFWEYMARANDLLKALVLLETFLLLTRTLDKTDKILSAAIGICAAGLVTASAYGLPNRESLHMLTLVWMTSFAWAMLWWAWRRGERARDWQVGNAGMLAAYLTMKTIPVIIWGFSGTKGWYWINDAVMLAQACCFLLWVGVGPETHKVESIAGANAQAEGNESNQYRSHRLT